MSIYDYDTPRWQKVALGILHQTLFSEDPVFNDPPTMSSRGSKRDYSGYVVAGGTTREYQSNATGGAGNELSRRFNRVKRKPVSSKRLVHVGLQPQVNQFTALSQFDTNVGAVSIGNALAATPFTPIHIFELTHFDNVLAETSTPYTPAAVGYTLNWSNSSATATLVPTPINGTTANGVGTSTAWQTMRGQTPGVALGLNVNKAVLRSTKISMNLYGARKRATRFQIMLVHFKDELADPTRFPTNAKAMKFVADLEHPLVYSNLAPRPMNWKEDIKIIKTWTYDIQPTTTIDLNTTTGKIVEVHLDIQHNKVMTMLDNQSTAIGAHLMNSSYAEYANLCRNSPNDSQRLHLIITAFAPERVEVTTAAETPSYDIVMRNYLELPGQTSYNNAA